MSAPRDADLSAIEEIRSRTGIGPTVRATVKAANVDELAALIEQTDSDRVDLLEIVDRLLSAPAPRETALRDQLLAMSDVDFEAWLEERGIAGRVRAAMAEHETAAPLDPCPKCGGRDHRVIFHNGSIDKGWRSRSCGFADHNTESAEHLHRYCQTCHYDWAARLSAPGPTDLDAEELHPGSEWNRFD